MTNPKRLKIVSMTPLKNEIELIDLDSGLTVYWKLGTALNTGMYKIGECYTVKNREIVRMPND